MDLGTNFTFKMKILIMRNVILTIIILLSAIVDLEAQTLKRKANWGFSLIPVTDSVAKANGMEQAYGFLVGRVFEGTTMDAAGVEENDIILNLNGQDCTGYEVFSHKDVAIRDGDDVTIGLLRKGKQKRLKGKAVGKPFEQSEDHDVIYEEVAFDNGKLRAIITKPKGDGPFPSILFIPGFSCISLDNMQPNHPYRKLIEQLTGLGYLVYRIEKPGMGDSEGTEPCSEIDFPTEVRAFETGYKAMKMSKYADKDELYLFGHSLGGVVAPFISAKHQPKGVIVYGTTHIPWHEYLVQMVRFQNPRMGEDYLDNEKDMQKYYTLFYDLHKMKKTPEELVNEDPDYARLLETALFYKGGDRILGRHYRFSMSLGDAETIKAWKETGSNVLSIYGEADIEAINDEAHKDIVDLVNHYHPDKATYQLLEKTNHSFIRVGTMKESFEAHNSGRIRKLSRTHYNPEIGVMISNWIQSLPGTN